MESLLEETSVIIVTYNHKKYIEDCINSICSKDKLELIIVDNNSTDGTADLIEELYPGVKLIRNSENTGFSKGVNLGVKNSNRKYVVILNPDTRFKENSIEELLKPLKEIKNIITVPKALLFDGSAINTCGNINHFTGLAFTRGLGDDISKFNQTECIKGLSGVCFAMERKCYWKIGGFDENYFLYMEDTDISWKIHTNGCKMLYIPNAVIYHDYVLQVPPEKIYHVERGRYIILKKYLTWREYLLLAPSLIMTEIFTWGYSILNGFSGIKYKSKAVKDGLTLDVKKVPSDKYKLLNSLEGQIPRQFGHNILGWLVTVIGNFIYHANLMIALKLMGWRLPETDISKIQYMKNANVIIESDNRKSEAK
ncbi:glycosyltransferase family 2 protein [Methanobacterium sp.]|uniref:glycosyltransferase family 2 protein n=1 Tax=Methanobacterium sp. TaxID=2164 RepID=UPI003C790109